MNVKQLIALLNTMPQDATVWVENHGEGRQISMGDVRTREGIDDADTGEEVDETVVCISSWS